MNINWKDLGISIILFLIIFIVVFSVISPGYGASSVAAGLLLLSYSVAMIYYFNKYPACWSSWKENMYASFCIGLVIAFIVFAAVMSWWISAYDKYDTEYVIRNFLPAILIPIISAVAWGQSLRLVHLGIMQIFPSEKKKRKAKKILENPK